MNSFDPARRFFVKCGAAASVTFALPAFATGGEGRTCRHNEVARPLFALHIVTRRLDFNDAKRLITKAREAGFNAVILAVVWRGSTALRSTPWVRSGRHVWSPSMLRDLSDHAMASGLRVIPQVPLLSKADVLFQGKLPELLFNQSTYDPRISAVYEVVMPILDEVLELTGAREIHIGHDEVWGWKGKDYEKGRLSDGEVILPPELFALDVETIWNYLKRKGVGTWMWGDMLVSKEEFPHITAHGSLHRGIDRHGYGPRLRKSIPREVVICDWQYRNRAKEFPTLRAFVDDGFCTLGATFHDMDVVKRFASYAAKHNAAGMVATTWYYVQRKDWDTVDRIIRQSSKMFEEAFGQAEPTVPAQLRAIV